MTLTTHVAVGTAIGTAVGNPVAGFFIGLASHHIIDAIPHSDPGSRGATALNIFRLRDKVAIIWVFGDILLAAAMFLSVFIWQKYNPTIFWTVFGASISDLVDSSPFWSGWLRQRFPIKQFHWFHEKVHFTIKRGRFFWLGIASQIILICLALGFIYYYPKYRTEAKSSVDQEDVSIPQPLEKFEDYGLLIENLGVSAPIIPNVDGLNEKVYYSALKKGVAQFKGSQNPDEKGNLFVFGHSSYFPGIAGTKFTEAFKRLNEMKKRRPIYRFLQRQAI